MSIALSGHAKDQIKRRKIPDELVRKAAKNPEEILPSFRDRKLRRIHIYGKILEVVTKTEGSKITIITAYYLKEENV